MKTAKYTIRQNLQKHTASNLRDAKRLARALAKQGHQATDVWATDDVGQCDHETYPLAAYNADGRPVTI